MIADFKTRKLMGSGLIMSSLNYLIQVYGSCSKYLISALQVQQNNAARHITKLAWMTPTENLLKQCNFALQDPKRTKTRVPFHED